MSKYFLLYQANWLSDNSPLKIWEKSRRIGATYAQAYEDVRDASRGKNPMDVWFSSADESAAREYIRYCVMWAKVAGVVASDVFESVIDSEKHIKVLSLEFSNGKRIHGLSSNPSSFRSKGGKVILDEFAWHEDQEQMWAAALPLSTWGFPVRVLSTYNGAGNRYFRMVDSAKKGNDWSLHSTPLQTAVEQGLADKILGKKLTLAERQNWLNEQRRKIGDEDKWQQEYCCIPIDETTAYLPWDLIVACESDKAGVADLYQKNECYAGMDIGRRRDLTVIWVVEKVGDVLWTREIVSLRGVSFAEQDAHLDRMMKKYKIQRICIDQSGIGEKPVEDAKIKYGWAVEGVIFTNAVKQNLAQRIKQKFEDRLVRIPIDEKIRSSHHAVKKITTTAGNVRFDAERTADGHADEFWAHALAIHAAGENRPAFGVSIETDERDDPRETRFIDKMRKLFKRRK